MGCTRRQRPSDAHLVDEFGLVGCPRRGHDVPVGTCLECERLQQVTRADDRVTEIRCDRPSSGHQELLASFLAGSPKRAGARPDR